MITAWLRAARGRMLPLTRWVTPSRTAASVLDLSPQDLRAGGVRGLILDLDNTVVPWGSAAPSADVVRWVSAVRAAGLAVCIVSNSFTSRARRVGEILGVPVVSWAAKPAPWAFRRALRVLGTAPAQTALVGDQLFTDILGGNLLGLRTILVEPLSPREFVTTRWVRRLEAAVRRMVGGGPGGGTAGDSHQQPGDD
ncbi:MAG: YqeG family HAD IIIA-type phosphatase [Armatimonadota bacterium]|nr:YqeG family HAD IIIA-type phosphatase [Armatimonadota bacterium]MDR7402468.1 YqeG family HAD IIIA-type phosphatase [Armatimonadota bacterium]MDR7403791.1 YqeG family HAD IIIA-type phosphatase [Armatimonadota bacterium]MDR7437845.1 YqeG family HAD IIIA-type phosphatase [Armatimonadota bacterium]MDR7472105.1 YqeG family HAD IIIA-type phosphatase [Armatimonadota bacterium]